MISAFRTMRSAVVTAVAALILRGGVEMVAQQPSGIRVSPVVYRGWTNSYVIDNGVVEAVVVPEVGRVMQFRFVGDADGPFWENRALDGKRPDAKSAEWGNFGGDKAWPAPQADWPKVTRRGWPPPGAFDSIPVTATVVPGGLDLVSEVDEHYGIRVTRRVRVLRGGTRMRIETEFEKVAGAEVKVGVWVVTQLKDPVRVYVPLPLNSIYPEGYNNQAEALPPSLKRDRGFLSMSRDAGKSYKIGVDAGVLLWVGSNHVVRVDSPRVKVGEYPDQGSSAEIYTNGDPNAYVELEMLGPLETLGRGQRVKRESVYTLFRRRVEEADVEARQVLMR